MSNGIHPIPVPHGGTVPSDAAPYRPPSRRLRKVAAGIAVGLSLVAGGVAVAQLPLQGSHVASVVTATQNPDDESTVPAPEQRQERTPATGGRGTDEGVEHGD